MARPRTEASLQATNVIRDNDFNEALCHYAIDWS
jgi:hypothetical protein